MVVTLIPINSGSGRGGVDGVDLRSREKTETRDRELGDAIELERSRDYQTRLWSLKKDVPNP